jgi:CRP/FNR family cyclic AMP-dependent transcriptional regulator
VPIADRLLYRIAHSFSLCELSTEGHCLGSGQLFLEIEVLYSQKTRRPPCLAGEPLRLATVAALTKCVIARISKEDITRVIHKEPAFAELFIAHLLARNSRVEEDLVDQLFNSSEKRLARTLLLLANFGKESRPEPIIAKVSQETLAEMIGTTRSRVSFFMNKFRKLGLIDYNGSIEIHSSLLNVVLHEQPQIKR